VHPSLLEEKYKDIDKNPLAHQELGNNVNMNNELIGVLPFYPISDQCATFPSGRKKIKDTFVYKNLMGYQ
jgi:hypothetical protein